MQELPCEDGEGKYSMRGIEGMFVRDLSLNSRPGLM